MAFGMARPVPADAFEALDGHGDAAQADGRRCRRAGATAGRAMAAFGPAGFLRPRYRPSGTGASLVPAEAVLSLTSGGTAPAVASLIRLSGEAGAYMEE